jgi:hypothetical protein
VPVVELFPRQTSVCGVVSFNSTIACQTSVMESTLLTSDCLSTMCKPLCANSTAVVPVHEASFQYSVEVPSATNETASPSNANTVATGRRRFLLNVGTYAPHVLVNDRRLSIRSACMSGRYRS